MKWFLCIAMTLSLLLAFGGTAEAQKKKRNYLQRSANKRAVQAATVFHELPNPTPFLFRHFFADLLEIVDHDTVKLRCWINSDAYADVTADLYGVQVNNTPEAAAFIANWFVENNNPNMVHPWFVSMDPRPLPQGAVYKTAIVPYAVPPFTQANLGRCLNTQLVLAGHAIATAPPYDGWAEELY